MKYLSLVTQYLVMIVRAIGVHLWLMFATAAGVVLIWFVPQVSNLWQQTPYGRTEAAGFAALLLVRLALPSDSVLAVAKNSAARMATGIPQQRHRMV